MTQVTAIISLLHEGAESHSGTRIFRQDPVLCWTLDRLSRCEQLDAVAVLCWEDQLETIQIIAAEAHAYVLVKGPRQNIASIQSIAAAQKFADGWRGGLLGTCDFDSGFHAEWTLEILAETHADAAVLIDPASGLVDPELVDRTILHARGHVESEIVFAPVAPGLSGPLIRKPLLERLRAGRLHPGRVLHYLPDQPMREPLSGEGCVPAPVNICRTTRHFKLDSQTQIRRIAEAAVSLNGTLIKSSAEELLYRFNAHDAIDPLPRDVTLEINTARATAPIYSPLKHLNIERGQMPVETARAILEQLSARDDARITLGGTGDPLLHPHVFEIIAAARECGIHAIHLETDLLCDEPVVNRLADSKMDVVSVFIPALSPATYQAIMGVDGLQRVIENVRRLVVRRTDGNSGVPVIAPTFVKCRQNLPEMEGWYDQWLRALGSAVIAGPSEFAGQIPFAGVADMSPPSRRGCARINQRLTILSDGSMVPCEQDVLGKMLLGTVSSDRLSDVWVRRFGPLRSDHAAGQWTKHPLCAACKEWNRP